MEALLRAGVLVAGASLSGCAAGEPAGREAGEPAGREAGESAGRAAGALEEANFLITNMAPMAAAASR